MSLNRFQQKGVGLPAALFVITLMAAIAVGINSLISQNARTFEEELRLTRAFYAAESGAGFGMSILFPPQAFPDYETALACPTVDREYDFLVDGLTACSINIACVLDADVDGVKYYTITSMGTCGDITRTVQVRTSHSD